jgi:hypothetical protein
MRVCTMKKFNNKFSLLRIINIQYLSIYRLNNKISIFNKTFRNKKYLAFSQNCPNKLNVCDSRKNVHCLY